MGSQTMTQTMSYRDTQGPAGPLGSTLSDTAAFGIAEPQISALQEMALGKGRAEAIVTGQHRHKYFRRPIIPFMQTQPPEVLFASQGEESAALVPPEPEVEQGSKDMGCQSDYRESDTQTDPYTPDYILPPGPAPEVLSLAHLTHGAGLPAGLAEVQMIERARQKREFEATLPPLTDEASLALRKKMMGEQELREWNVREAEMLLQQEENLAVFDKKLRAQSDAREQHWDERVEHTRQIKLTEKDKGISEIQRRRIKALRKLSEARKSIEGGHEKRDIVTEYADYGSEVYAPLARNGNITRDKLAHQYETKPLQLETLAGLEALERAMPARLLRASVVRPGKKGAVGYGERQTQRLQVMLERTDAALKAAKQAKPSEKEQKEALLAAYRDTKPVERPPTPTAPPVDTDEEMESGCILLQRLLRGRAIQNMMYEGKERRLELIHELRSDESAPAVSEEAEAEREVQAALGGLADGLQADLVGSALDTMSKELRRFTEERRIAELLREAERSRRVREAEESGTRQAELVERAEQQERCRQLMRVHNASVTTYIGEALREAVEESAAAQAAAQAQLKHSHFDTAEAQVEARGGNPREIIDDVVSNFLFPEVVRQSNRREAEADESKFGSASTRAVEILVGEVEGRLE